MVELFSQGGPVLWIIMVCGVVALVVFIERSLHLHRARIRFEDFLKGIFNILRRRNIEEALAICEETPGPVAYIVRIAILHRSADREAMRTAIQDAGSAEISRLERRLVIVATVAQIAPLLGLLGTVLGMVNCLLTLYASAPLVQSADILGGVMHALLTTGAGLMVAIPCYVAFNLLVLKIDRLVLDMEMASSEIVSFLQEQRSGDEETP
ncbi:MAG: MotA/TolQ/ExbB proton channel family protein [Kiritimatiellia bacterium]|jgi:biopolymer transport protein ExbB|nr:MotA/TolQ/ExbB proton channel family protein [Kiritimatiellia bacterium]MDP6631106.1 MotA/TolQ/ExbB proton channel family protein [Kiritimatiellia bacterium]MDP6810063.1 MotA/TolQ/ExbB proton channel family protein [Kiritimatiellia bacterium]MDP7024834.1 MotA/TolQ/ExbB proton channel family protein [Kiritimatiellia bacterium]